MKVCRVCLSMGVKMYDINNMDLLQMYESVAGIDIEENDKLPKMLCWECAGRLRSANKFKEKVIKASKALSLRIQQNTTGLSVDDINLITTIGTDFKSSLVTEYATNHFDLITQHIENIKEELKLETESEGTTEYNNYEGIIETKFDVKFDKGKHDNDKIENIRLHDSNINDSDAVSEKEHESLKSDDENSSVTNSEDYNLVNSFENIESKNKRDTISESDRVTQDIIEKKVGGRNIVEKMVGIKKVGLKNRIRVKRKAKRAILKDFSPSEIIERYRTTGVVQRSNMKDFTITALNFEEQIAELQKRQESVSYRRAPYKCTVCYTGFQLKGCLDNHTARHSEKHGQYECFICKKRFISYTKLRRHITALHTEQFSCNKCDYVTRTKSTAMKHQNWHMGKQYPCPHCEKVFSNYTTCASHVRLVHPSKYACELCGYTFISLRGVYMHKKKRHNTEDAIRLEGPFCESCDITFASQEAYERHLSLSTQHNSGHLHRKSNLNNPHRMNRPGGEKFPPPPRTRCSDKFNPISCEVCDKKLSGNREYNSHIKTYHPGHNRTKYATVRTTMCEICGKIYTGEAGLKFHMMSHTGEANFKCSTCGKQFSTQFTLKQHQTVHSQVQHKCPHCERGFSFVQNLQRHINAVHGGVRRHRCDICGKLLSSAGSRREHISHVHQRLPRPQRARPPRANPRPDPPP